jgi:hypothetical protein
MQTLFGHLAPFPLSAAGSSTPFADQPLPFRCSPKVISHSGAEGGTPERLSPQGRTAVGRGLALSNNCVLILPVATALELLAQHLGQKWQLFDKAPWVYDVLTPAGIRREYSGDGSGNRLLPKTPLWRHQDLPA